MQDGAREALAPTTVVVVTGLSGAGKSTALRVFEDMGYFCVDGLPMSMVPRMVSLYQGQQQRRNRGLVVGMDIRQQDFLQEWNEALADLRREEVALQVIFLEAGTGELMRRYAETRRPHPLESENLGLEQALATERASLEPIRAQADLVIDTSHFSIHDLRRVLQEKWCFLEAGRCGLRIHILSFGYKFGLPAEADLVFDLRFLPNPHFVPELKPLSGKDAPVAAYVLGNEFGRTFQVRLLDFLAFLVPLYATEGRFRLTIALGCTGGRHRSVAVAEAVFAALKEQSYAVTLEHRHMNRS
jgi:UPF0042 nucleotide-binding protein